MKIGQTLPALLIILFTILPAVGDDTTQCVKYKVPAQKSVVTAPVCTLGVDSTCKPIVKAEISVRYFPPDSDAAVVTTIGTLWSPPFVKAWDLKKIPNQLFIGIGAIIDVTFSNGETARMRREGIFLAHRQPETPPTYSLPYEFSDGRTFAGDTISFPSQPLTFARAFWNEHSITFKVEVADSLFRGNEPASLLEQMGIEILLDPSHKRRPYPTEEVMIFVIPLSGKPYRVTYKPVFGDSGNYRLDQFSIRGNFDYSIERKEGKGFGVTFAIPYYLFGKSLPQEMGCNVIAKIADAKGKIVPSSWIDAKGYNNYSPYLWGTVAVAPKPLVKTRWIILAAAFAGGLFLTLFFYFVSIAIFRDRPSKPLLIKRSKDEDKIFEQIKMAMDHHIIRHDLSIKEIAAELNLPPKKLIAVVKKVTGLSFKKYLMYLRTEIVCERLRSSHSGESTIAESCGFRNVKEMVGYFKKFHHMTPNNFRRVQQITQGQ
jgi:AraC-like DNA-binding protein